MTEVQNSYLQRYEMKQQTHSSRSLGKQKSPQAPADAPIENNSLPATVSRLAERVDGIEVKLTSLINVVRLVQRYTETRDQQYQKEKESDLLGLSPSPCASHCAQAEMKAKEFELLSKQFKEEIKMMQHLRATCTFAPPVPTLPNYQEEEDQEDQREELRQMERRMRAEIDKKMEICVNLITSNLEEQRVGRGLADKVNQVAFTLNQLENECRRNKMMLEKEVDTLAALIKETSTQLPAFSRLTEQALPSKSPPKPLSKNSKSQKSISKGKQNRSAIVIQPKDNSKVREEELREALKRKKEHREKLKVKNW